MIKRLAGLGVVVVAATFLYLDSPPSPNRSQHGAIALGAAISMGLFVLDEWWKRRKPL